jgi:hypothetical protein
MLLLLAGGITGLIRNPAFGGWVRAPAHLNLFCFHPLQFVLAAGCAA